MDSPNLVQLVHATTVVTHAELGSTFANYCSHHICWSNALLLIRSGLHRIYSVLGLSSVHTVASSDGKTRKGDVIAYSTEVSNSGNTCLTDVQVTDGLLGGNLDCGTGTREERECGYFWVPV